MPTEPSSSWRIFSIHLPYIIQISNGRRRRFSIGISAIYSRSINMTYFMPFSFHITWLLILSED